MTNRLFVFERLQVFLQGKESFTERIGEERYYTRYAWDAVLSGDWFTGGGLRSVSEWAESFRHAPHDSFLDIGLAFGKASFYGYSGVATILIVVNIIRLITQRLHISNSEQRVNLITSALFLSLTPMFISLSIGLTMTFIFWLVLGAYPLLHPSQRLPEASPKVSIFRRIKL